MLSVLLILLGVFLLFGLTIFVHELGHFLVARWCGLVVETFSIGFGQALWKTERNGVTYKIGWLPLGGYVSLPQMDPTLGLRKDEEGEKARVLPRVPAWKKILVALAGVTMNMFLAFLLAWVVFLKGMPASPDEYSSRVGYVDPASEVYQQGLRTGDEITAVNGEPVKNWKEFITLASLNGQVKLTVKRVPKTFLLDVPTKKTPNGSLSMVPGVSGENFCKVMNTVPGSSAEKAGIQADDLIVRFAGETVRSQAHLVALVDAHRDEDVPVTVRRGDRELTLRVTPAYNEKAKRALIGIVFNNLYRDNTVLVHPRPLTQLRDHSRLILRVLKALTNRHEARHAAGSLGGPLLILFMFYKTIQTSFIVAIWFTGLLNVNLAILNLLPLPILDGGHIVFALWEMLFRRPVPPRLVMLLSNIFFALFILVFLILTYRDLVHFILPNLGFGGTP